MVGRRSFIKGLGALLATSAMVRPAAPVIEAITSATSSAAPMFWINGEGYLLQIVAPWQYQILTETSSDLMREVEKMMRKVD